MSLGALTTVTGLIPRLPKYASPLAARRFWLSAGMRSAVAQVWFGSVVQSRW
ncbi:hypothetical protein ABZV31_04230 [Streptomyces sp. NPDC005202]|uniref:hypothetical protein n=1 Tax=Streptomyces sp. NPDC005202 TaxID=3157021 RepID=UPI0033AEFC74